CMQSLEFPPFAF
nr:immunoglobulin light chain junction region [Macaca mulatta]